MFDFRKIIGSFNEDKKAVMEDFRNITVTEGSPLIIHNPTTYKLLGQGAQGAVFQLSSDRCVKIYAREKDVLREKKVLAAAKASNSPFFPELYETGRNYVVMEFLKGPTLPEYLKEKKAFPKWVANQLIEMLQDMERLKLTRLDARPRHIYVVKSKRLKVIDHVYSYKKKHPYPRKLLEELGLLGYRDDFMKQVLEVDAFLYNKWIELQNQK
ncbi:Predicted Ser/Thr protein kinase [Paenibacillus sp. yr247]|nr:Predicted Ser/Thr protein kinase [Paenibacillus sp. yr247]